MNLFKTLSFFIISILCFSCATISCNDGGMPNSISSSITTNKLLPRKSFLKINRHVNFKVCPDKENEDECFNQVVKSSGSGFIIDNIQGGAFIITAAHVCDVSDIVEYISTGDTRITFTNDKMFVEDVFGDKFSATILEMDAAADLCVAFVHGINNPPVKIAYFAPNPGDEAHNLAAPVGFMGRGLIPTLHGNFNGIYGRYASYSIPAVGGSSGSPIFNTSGEVIGMIHSVHTRFQFLTFSPTHKEIYDLASKYINL